jgi:hypothetical protein
MCIAREKNLVLTPPTLSIKKMTDDVISSTSEFKQLSIKGDKLEYLNGWQVQSKEGKIIELHLDNIYVDVSLRVRFTMQLKISLSPKTQ